MRCAVYCPALENALSVAGHNRISSVVGSDHVDDGAGLFAFYMYRLAFAAILGQVAI